MEAAVKVISANGYTNSPVSKIAMAAGTEEETVYLYFDSIEEIMVEVFNQFLGDIIEEIWIEVVGITNSAEKLKMLNFVSRSFVWQQGKY